MVKNKAKRYQWWMVLVILMLLGTRERDTAWPAESPSSAATKARAIQMLKASPAVFIENQGQWDEPAVRFALTSPAANAGLTSTSIRFQLFKREPIDGAHASSALQPPPRPGAKAGTSFRTQMHSFETVLEGARPVAPAGLAASPQRFNYRRGEQSKWRENVPAWESVRYAGIYPGIDLVVAGRQGGIKYEFHAAPGADLKKVALRYEGLEGLRLREDGALELTPAAGWTPLVDAAPTIYQEVDGARKPVAGRFRLITPNTVGFELTGPYDPARPLVIDPDVAWSSYLGGSGSNAANAVAVDPAGNILVTGNSYSANWLTGGGKTSVDTSYGDAFVTKFTPTGERLWSSSLGSGSYDSGCGIATDRLGSIYVCG